MADYQYVPIYGTEPFKDSAGVGLAAYGGGAELTAQNLLISLWTVTASGPNGPSAGRLLRPLATTAEGQVPFAPGITGMREVGLNQCAPSRTSTRFLFTRFESEAFNYPILAVLNPPSDLKSQLANAVRGAVDPTQPLGVTLDVLKPLLQSLMPEIYIQDADNLNGGFVGDPENGTVIFGSPYAPLSPTFLGMCASSGADGVFPTFYPPLVSAPLNPQAFINSIAQINAGNFFFPALITLADPDAQFGLTINWPHTAARG